MNHLEYKEKVKENIRTILQSLLEDNMGLIEGARKLCSLRYELGDDFEINFRYFVTVDSETDHLILEKKEDTKISEGYLSRCISEAEIYEKAERSAKNMACKKLLDLLGEAQYDYHVEDKK